MRTKIESLTKDQEAELIKWREKYLSYGLSCEPAHRMRAEDAIHRAYRSIGKEPVPILWVGSPLSANVLIHLLQNPPDNLRANLRANLGANLGDNLGANLGDHLGDNRS